MADFTPVDYKTQYNDLSSLFPTDATQIAQTNPLVDILKGQQARATDLASNRARAGYSNLGLGRSTFALQGAQAAGQSAANPFIQQQASTIQDTANRNLQALMNAIGQQTQASQFGQTFGENQRQFGQTFGENQRQFNINDAWRQQALRREQEEAKRTRDNNMFSGLLGIGGTLLGGPLGGAAGNFLANLFKPKEDYSSPTGFTPGMMPTQR